ncbi:MAG: hypothetical protein U0R24_07025 [Solirubrobacterales bacterium]
MVCDRFTDSTVAYQRSARGLDPALVASLNAAAVDGCMPRAHGAAARSMSPTQPEQTEGRSGGEERGVGSRFEREGAAFQRTIAEAFDRITPPSPAGWRSSCRRRRRRREVHGRVLEAVGGVGE